MKIIPPNCILLHSLSQYNPYLSFRVRGEGGEIREAEIGIGQGKLNKIQNTNMFFACSLKWDYIHYRIHIRLASSQTDAIVWNILANRSVWELCTRRLMKNWGCSETGYYLGEKQKSQFLGIDLSILNNFRHFFFFFLFCKPREKCFLALFVVEPICYQRCWGALWLLIQRKQNG